MEIPEEDNAQVAKRKAIQAIMRDLSLSAAEKQQQIQQVINKVAVQGGRSGGGIPLPSGEIPTPISQPSPTSHYSPSPPMESTMAQASAPVPASPVSRETLQAIMRDTTSSPQERQFKIQQAMMAGGGVAPPQPVPAPAPEPSRPIAPSAVEPSSKTQAIQALMRDPSIPAQEKQRRIQEIMASGGGGPPQPAPVPATVTEHSPPAAPAAVEPSSKTQAIQALMRDSSIPAQEKQRRIQESMASGGGGPPQSVPVPAPLPEPSPPAAPAPVEPISKTQVIQALMRDSSIPAQEKQRRIQEIMASGGGGPPQPQIEPPRQPMTIDSPSETPESPPPALAVLSSREAIQAIMRDTSLTPQERQNRIQQAMEQTHSFPNEAATTPAAALASTPPPRGVVVTDSKRRTAPAATTPGAVSSTAEVSWNAAERDDMARSQTQAPTAVATSSNAAALSQIEMDARIKAQARPSRITAPSTQPFPGGMAQAMETETSASQPGAVASTGGNRFGKNPRTSTVGDASERLRQFENAVSSATGGTEGAVPPGVTAMEADARAKAGVSQAAPASTPGAVVSIGGNRSGKAARASARASTAAERLRDLEDAAVNQGIGEDSANHKITAAQTSIASSTPTGVDSASSKMAAFQDTSSGASSPPVASLPTHMPSLAAVAMAWDTGRSDVDTNASQEPNRARQLESEILDKSAGGAPALPPAPPPPRQASIDPPVRIDSFSPQTSLVDVAQDTPEVPLRSQEPTEPETYAGLNFNANNIAGGEDGGFQVSSEARKSLSFVAAAINRSTSYQ
jgi:hypothetical protein